MVAGLRFRKKAFVLVFSLICAIVVCEIALRIMGLPAYGVQKYIIGLDQRSWEKSRIYSPHSRYLVTEGGHAGKVFARNNLGLPGLNIRLDGETEYILILGSSFIEAQQVYPREIFTSRINQALEKDKSNYAVLNLGFRGTNPYTIYHRALYWNSRIPAEKVFLIIDHYPFQQQPNNFTWDVDTDFGQKDTSLLHNFYLKLRNYSRMANLLIPASDIRQPFERNPDSHKKGTSNQIVRKPYDEVVFQSIIRQYQKTWGDNLVIVCIMKPVETEDGQFPIDLLGKICTAERVPFYYSPIMANPDFRINGGHLSSKGHAALGQFLLRIIRAECE
jgi:hypothetical protein